MREKKLVLNTIMALFNQVIAIICGLILPRAILQHYGSEVNGLVSSIMQFLGVIAFMEFGVGVVTQSALYKPLAEKDDFLLSKIMISAKKYFQNIAKIFLIYIAILIFAYPRYTNQPFDYWFTSMLIVAMAINSFCEYYFGIVNQQLLNADQKSYIQFLLKTGTQIVNTIVCVILIKMDCSIQTVKFTTSVIYMLRPLFQSIYVNRHYNIDYKIKYEGEPIKQKWNGLAQHVAAVILDKTDVVLLTLFSSLSNVSIYSVYYLVVNSLQRLIVSCTIGIQSLFGNLLARSEYERLYKMFDIAEVVLHFVITMVYCICGCLIIPFVKVYTKGISDANYILPVFAVIIVLANALASFKSFYNIMIKAAGHYRETQVSAIIEVVINITISMLLIHKYELVGVAIGTLIAMMYRTLYFVWYLSKNILKRKVSFFLKNILIDMLIVVSVIIVNSFLPCNISNYFDLVIYALMNSCIIVIIGFAFNYLFYREKIKYTSLLLKR